MSNRRVLKAAQAIREVVSMSILTDLKDPRVSDVTVTFVEVSPDMRLAKVHVSVMGDETKQNLCLQRFAKLRRVFAIQSGQKNRYALYAQNRV